MGSVRMHLTRKVKFAPCGDCGETTARDDMHSMNVKFFDPHTDTEHKVPIRLCSGCRVKWQIRLESMEWDNGSMFVKEVAAK